MSGWAPSFDWVTPELAVGGAFPAEAVGALARDHGLSAVVDLREEACDDAEVLRRHGLDFLHLPTEDCCGVAQDALDRGVAFAARALAERRKLLIHCEHGIGRSATLALCVLVDRGLRPMAALERLKEARGKVSPSPAQYGCWRDWLEQRGVPAPSLEAFQGVAYRHLLVG